MQRKKVCLLEEILTESWGFPQDLSCVILNLFNLPASPTPVISSLQITALAQTGVRARDIESEINAYLEHSSCSTKDSSAMFRPVKLGQVLDVVAVSAASVMSRPHSEDP